MRNNVVFLVPLTTVALVAAQPVYAQASFSGSFTAKTEEGTVRLTLRQKDDGTVSGAMNDGSTELELRGTVAGDGKKASGKFYLEGQETPIAWEMRRDGTQYRFAMIVNGERDEWTFTRSGGAGGSEADEPAEPRKPSAPAKPAKPATKVPSPKAAPEKLVPPSTGNAYRHPSGVSFRLPDGWKVLESGLMTVLLPPGQSKPAEGEVYMIFISQSGDATSADDPRIQGWVDKVLGKGGLFGPNVGFDRVGKAPGGATYSADTPSGKTLYARSVISDPDRLVLGIISIGEKAKVQSREKALQAVTASVRVSNPERDSRLVGRWGGGVRTSGIDARDSSGRSQASSASDSSTTFAFAPEGTYVQTTTSRTIAIGQGVAIDSGDQVEKTELTWCASNGRICFFIPGGLCVTGKYRFEGNSLVVTIDDKSYVLRRL